MIKSGGQDGQALWTRHGLIEQIETTHTYGSRKMGDQSNLSYSV
jgi:hypothetical protein